MEMLLIATSLGAIWGLGALANAWVKRGEVQSRALHQRTSALVEAEAGHERRVAEDRQAIEILAREKALGFPWLASAYAEYFELQDLRAARRLQTKKRPAKKAAQAVKEAGARRREAEKRFRITRDRLRYYEALFPWLTDFVTEDIDGLLDSLSASTDAEGVEDGDPTRAVDPVSRWLTPEEYKALGSAEKSQLALDRWSSSQKSNWEIGREYERYVGYLHEREGFKVTYWGAVAGLEDRGRDLIAESPGEVRVIQCKYWASEKTIHEKHIFQLYGTCVEYLIKDRGDAAGLVDGAIALGSLPRYGIEPWFVTSTKLSDVARQAAQLLGVTVVENQPLSLYPRIKCNVARRTGEKIYHLPFDQQYDKILIEPDREESYIETVAEAEALGFRRAYRWRGKE